MLLTSTAGEATKKSENGNKTRTATRRLMLCRELLKDAIYMATKAVDKYSRRGYKEVREQRQDENGDKKAHVVQRAAQGPIYMATKAVDKYSRRGYKEWRQEGSCCAESCSRTPSTWLPRLSTSTAGEATKNGDKKARAAQRALSKCRNRHH